MKKNHTEEMIHNSLKEDLYPGKIDIRKQTMARIMRHEEWKEKFRALFQWGLTLITFFASLFSLYIFEVFSKRFSLFFQAYAVNILTVKLLLQFFFAGILLAAVVIMISNFSTSTKKPAYNHF